MNVLPLGMYGVPMSAYNWRQLCEHGIACGVRTDI